MTIRNTPCGAIRGVPGKHPGTVAFKGIRYATAGRWEYPTQVTHWEGVYDATRYGSCSYQPRSFYNEEENSYYIQGYFENKSKNDIEFIYIEYLVYDENDVLLGTAYCSIDTLKANTKWKFKAVYSDFDSNEASKFELSKVEFY